MRANAGEARRLVFIGAECTGKSTLAQAVAAALGEPCSNEYVRDHVESLDRPLDLRDLEPIARNQLRYEDDAHAAARDYVVHDTNILSSILYAQHYFGARLPWVDEVLARRRYHRYFLCQPDFPWIADPGQRESPEARRLLHEKFRSLLEERGIDYVTLQGPVEERLETVLAACR